MFTVTEVQQKKNLQRKNKKEKQKKTGRQIRFTRTTYPMLDLCI